MMFFRPVQNSHKHVFLVKLPEALATWQKRDCPGDRAYFRGVVRQCECGAYRFKPHGPGLREVEVWK